MDTVINIVLPIIVVIVLLFCGAFFAASETAFTSLSRVDIRNMLKNNVPNAKKIAGLRENLDLLISAVLIGTNFITTLNSALVTAVTVRLLGDGYVSYGTAVISILVILFSEIVPKTLSSVKKEKIASLTAPVILVLYKVFFPINWIMTKYTKAIDSAEHHLVKTKRPLVTEEELKTLIEVGGSEGTLESDEKRMLSKIFEFTDLHVKDMMKHRSLVRGVMIDSDFDHVITAFKESGFSRLVVYDKDGESVVGILHYKSVLFADPAIIKSHDFVKICMVEPLFVPGTLTAEELLQHFKKDRNNIAIVVNEYGETSGIVTMDDLLKSVFGRMTDEYGATDISPEKRVQVVGTNEFVIPGDMKIDDFNQVMNLDIDSEDFDTLGGWLLERFGELPSIGAIYKQGNVLYMVEDQSSRRIQSVRVCFL